MKRIIFVFVFLLATFLTIAQQQKYTKVKIYFESGSLLTLSALGIPVEEGQYKEGAYFICEISETDIQKLAQHGIEYDVMIDDMTAYYIDRNLNPEKYNSEKEESDCNNVPDLQTPSHFHLGSVGGFYSLEELYAQLDSMRANYPDLISIKQQVGTINTIEGRPTYFVRISDNPDTDETEPEVLYTALTHAREPMGMQQLVYFMWYLLENYTTNNEIQQLLDNTELYFVPCVNPDGYNYNCVNEPNGGGMWRKNLRNSGNGDFGVDLNRNYGYQWGYDDIGSSPYPSDETYRGISGFSEPETQSIKWFCENRQFVLAIDYHCYGNLLIYPWGYIDGAETQDSLLYHAYSELMTEVNAYVSGTGIQTVGYSTNGVSLDWYYGEQSTKNKIIAFSPEAGNASDGFWPASNRIEDIAKENVGQNLYMARFAGKFASVNDLSPLIISQQNGYIKFDIERLGLSGPSSFTVSLDPLSSNIVSVGNPKVFSSLSLLQKDMDSISYALSGSTQSGELLRFLLSVDNGLYVISDTITKIYGTEIIAFNDDCSSLLNWTSGGWGICSSEYYSSSSSIADSPIGNYSDNEYKSISMNSAIDLTNCAAAFLTFMAKWDIETGYDYVQLQASTDGGSSWIPLCGNYTKPGSAYQDEGAPLYDGIQSSWVQESMDLTDYIGQNILFQFFIISDNYSTGDGFFFDDFTVTKVGNGATGIPEMVSGNSIYVSEPFPNPAGSSFSISYQLNERSEESELIIFDGLGRSIMIKNSDSSRGTLYIDSSRFRPGIYYYLLKAKQEVSEVKQLIIIQ